MEVYRRSSWLLLLLGVSLLATTLQGVQGEAESEGPSESECRPYIEKALKELGTGEISDTGASDLSDSKEDLPTVEITTDDTDHQQIDDDDDDDDDGDDDTREESEQTSVEDTKSNDEQINEQEDTQTHASEESKEESTPDEGTHEEDDNKTDEENGESVETDDKKSEEAVEETTETDSHEQIDEEHLQQEQQHEGIESNEDEDKAEVDDKESQENQNESTEEIKSEKEESQEQSEEQIITQESQEDDKNSKEAVEETGESIEDKTDSKEDETKESAETEAAADEESAEQQSETAGDNVKSAEDDGKSAEDDAKSAEDDVKSAEDEGKSAEDDGQSSEKIDNSPETVDDNKDDSKESEDQVQSDSAEQNESAEENVEKSDAEESSEDDAPEEALGMDVEIPTELREREHVEHLLKLDDESSETENVINRIAEITLRELKKLYENAIKPLETLYKYRDLSNRHFGDAEIFSKPLILFMGPWSGGKSSIINYLLNNEYNETSLRTGAEPSPAYFNILMYGDEPEVIDGTQLAADFTFSGLQKFGQGLEERLRGIKLPSKLLEKVNIVEIPGILEVRKQVSRVFPFNDACQWFIDRADIIFLVYDPSKLDVGPETEAILDQLKGREHQSRIILNKADQVKPEELMRVQGALIWNISPLMSSAQPPVMYTTSLWSRPYEIWAPVRLLQAQERAFLRDLRSAIDKRIENKIASARRFAVRVRNHAKMVDCYLTTYYNHKSVFGNRKQVADQIIEHPQDYHIYEGLSTLTNISRYDLPDPDVYRDFFKLNPLYDFQQLSATCTYFRGCPINRLDIAIAYDLPELVGKHKRLVESALAEVNQTPES